MSNLVDSPTHAKRRLEAQLVENQKRIELAGTLGESLLRQQSKINSRILDLENYHGDELTPELMAKLADLEKEYSEVERCVSKTLLPVKGRDTTEEQSSLSGAGNLSPTKPVAMSRRQRNANLSRHKDIELAADIGQTLIAEVRKLQGIIAEKDECIKSRTGQQTLLERQLRSTENRLRAMDESEEKFKDENWNLELQTQELKKQLGDSTSSVTRLTADVTRLQSTVDSQTDIIESMKAKETQLLAELEEKRSRFENEMLKQKSAFNALSRDRSDLQRSLDQFRTPPLGSPTPTKKRPSRGSTLFDDDQSILLLPKTPEQSPIPSPVKGTPSRNAPLEAETAKATLAHWQSLSHRYKAEADLLRSENKLLKTKLDNHQSDNVYAKTSLPAPPSRPSNTRKRLSRPRPLSEMSITEEEFETAASSAYGTADELPVEEQTETEAYRTVDEDFMSDGERTETGFRDNHQRLSEQSLDYGLDDHFSQGSEDELQPPTFRIPRFKPRHRVDSRIFSGPPQPLNQELGGRRISAAFSEQSRVETVDIGIQANPFDQHQSSVSNSDISVQFSPILVDVSLQKNNLNSTPSLSVPEYAHYPGVSYHIEQKQVDTSPTVKVPKEPLGSDSPITTNQSCQTDFKVEVLQVEVKAVTQTVCIQTENEREDVSVQAAQGIDTRDIGVQTLSVESTSSRALQVVESENESSRHEEVRTPLATLQDLVSTNVVTTESVGVQTEDRGGFAYGTFRTSSTIKLPSTPIQVHSLTGDAETPNTFGGDRHLSKTYSRPPLPVFRERTLSLDGHWRIQTSPNQPSTAIDKTPFTNRYSATAVVTTPDNKLMGPPARSAIARATAVQSLRGVKSASQFGVLDPPTLRPSPSYSSPRRSSRMRDSRGLAPSLSTHSKRSSLSSFVSEVDARFGLREDVDPISQEQDLISGHTDPSLIQAITQTMIGEFLWKYTRKRGRQGISENRHRRFFWVHPYTKTLYWSDQNPAVTREDDLKAKSCPIQQVRLTTDDNPFPPGLYHKSLVVLTPSRALKFTAPTKTRHDVWFTALDYLLNHSTHVPVSSLPVSRGTQGPPDNGGITDNDIAEFDPNQSHRHREGQATNPSTALNSASQKNSTQTQKKGHSSFSRFSSLLGTATFGSRRTRHASLDIYDTVQEGDSMIEGVLSEYEANSLDNVRSCCNGKHDVGTLSRSRGRRIQKHHHRDED